MDVSAEIFTQVDNMCIEVEMPTKDLAKFSWKYTSMSCESVPTGGPVILRDTMHGGENCRIYFNADEFLITQLAMLGYKALDGHTDKARGNWHKEYRWRLDSNHLFWILVRNGFQLGCWPVQEAAVTVAA